MVELISSLCRGAWDESRGKAYALTLLASNVPIDHLAMTARELLTQIDPDDITPAKLIATAKLRVPERLALPEPRREAVKWHPGEGTGGNRPPVVSTSENERRGMRDQYARMARETAERLAEFKREEQERRGGKESPLRKSLSDALARLTSREEGPPF